MSKLNNFVCDKVDELWGDKSSTRYAIDIHYNMKVSTVSGPDYFTGSWYSYQSSNKEEIKDYLWRSLKDLINNDMSFTTQVYNICIKLRNTTDISRYSPLYYDGVNSEYGEVKDIIPFITVKEKVKC
jgi:hypothetical protein